MTTTRNVHWSNNLPFDDSTQATSNSRSATPLHDNFGKPPRQCHRKLQSSLKPPSFATTAPTTTLSPPIAAPSSQSMTELPTEIFTKYAQELKDSREGHEAWRKHGKIFRATLIMADEESGGNTFVLSNQCSIEKYYDVAERVLNQFLKISVDEKAELTESYLVGTRLVKFLSTVLPTHKDYFAQNSELDEMRSQSQAQLVELLQYLERLALIIDEVELNKYILNDLTDNRPHANQILKQEKLMLSSHVTEKIVDGEKKSLISTSNKPTNSTMASNVFDEMKSLESTEINTTMETTTWMCDLNVKDTDFSPTRAPHPFFVPQQDDMAWQTDFSLQYSIDPRREEGSNANGPSFEFPLPSDEWNPDFPVTFCLPQKAQCRSPSVRQKHTSRTSNKGAHHPQPRKLAMPQLSGEYSDHEVTVTPQKALCLWPIKVGLQAPMERESSPKSVAELSEWGVEDLLVEPTYLQFMSHDDPLDAKFQDDELSLTDGINHRRQNRNQLSKLKGCIQCLID